MASLDIATPQPAAIGKYQPAQARQALAELAVFGDGIYVRLMIDEVRLRPVQADEFDAFIQAVLAQYVRDMVANASMSRDEAKDKAEKNHAAILPDGFAIPDHNFYFIEDAVRGARLGRQTMLLLEEETRQRGLHRTELNVFAGNVVARSLYKSMGYVEVAVRMRKRLLAHPEAHHAERTKPAASMRHPARSRGHA